MSPGIALMTRRARARDSSRRPAWLWSAPQQAPALPGSRTAPPAASITRMAARWSSRIHASITQPVKRNTGSPAVGEARRVRVIAAARSRGTPSRRGISPSRWLSQASHVRASRTMWRGSTTRYAPHSATRRRRERDTGRRDEPRVPLSAWSASRAASMRCPKGTNAGHTGSHPRHCTHSFIIPANSSSSGAPAHWTSRIAAIRPRGDARSSPVTLHVGHAGRQRPHATHRASSSSSTRSGPAPRATVTTAGARD